MPTKAKASACDLAAVALADAVARDLTIIPLCPYMARYLERHDVEGARIEWPNRAPRARVTGVTGIGPLAVVLPAREVPLGGLRSMNVQRALPQRTSAHRGRMVLPRPLRPATHHDAS